MNHTCKTLQPLYGYYTGQPVIDIASCGALGHVPPTPPTSNNLIFSVIFQLGLVASYDYGLEIEQAAGANTGRLCICVSPSK